MKRPATVFDKPQWKLLPDPARQRFYGNVSNRLEVTVPPRTWYVPLAVPTELFSLMLDLWKVSPQAQVTLHMDAITVERRVWHVFSVFVATPSGPGGPAKEELFDLWAQTSLPDWMRQPEFRLRA